MVLSRTGTTLSGTDLKGCVTLVSGGYRSVRRPADAEEVAQIEPFRRKIGKLEIDAVSMAAVRCHASGRCRGDVSRRACSFSAKAAGAAHTYDDLLA